MYRFASKYFDLNRIQLRNLDSEIAKTLKFASRIVLLETISSNTSDYIEYEVQVLV